MRRDRWYRVALFGTLATAVVYSCATGGTAADGDAAEVVAGADDVSVAAPEQQLPAVTDDQLADILDPAQRPVGAVAADMPDAGCVKLRINPLPGGTLGRVFNDSNHVHLDVVQRLGITPITGPAGAWSVDKPLRRVTSCTSYYVDDLTMSLPYLIPSAEKLLADIGDAFRDSLRSRGGGDYRIKVTSLLRTEGTVSRLRRRNRNAVEQSAHLYGTTFDISYVKFVYDGKSTPHTQEDLKNLLGEVLWDMREQGRCYVKYERKQACFHISTRI